jgi:hypothetical protein
MYHPATNETVMEWLELYNQMAVNVDMTGWSLDGDIHYAFPSNTIARGGGFIVIAASPATLMAATGLTNVLGPLTNQLPNGSAQLLLRDNFGRVVNELDYDVNGDWPVGPNGSGVSLAKLDHSTASAPPQNWAMSAQMGGTPGKENFPTNVPPVPLAFNEISGGTNGSFWLELLNYGTNSLPLSGYVIVWNGYTNGQYVWSPGVVLSPGGAIAISNNTLGFLPTNNDRLFLLPPARTNVLDAMEVKKTPRARSPDGVGAWLRPTVLTPGASNNFTFHRELVINEIMYDHQSLPATNVVVPGAASSEQWLELYNRSTNTVDLTGWSLSGGISYNFPSGKTIAAGAYLVVAKDSAALRLSYPTIDIIGDYSGKLSHNGDTIELDDQAGNPANIVTYYPGGRWPEAASGGGSSLELMDPLADNSQPGAWAASNESGKSSWQTYSYQMVAINTFGTNLWNDFIMGLLTDGECYVDDISLIESPGGSKPVQFLSNTNFENGATGWRFVGNHNQSRVEPEPGNPSNHVLHIIAGGVQGDVLDHVETTFAGGHKITLGNTYQISFRARWLSGNNLLNTRAYYNLLARTTVLPVPALNGTPGAQNSRYATNIGPTFTGFKHSPVIPPVSQPVTVSVAPQDPQGVSACEVWWSTNGGAFSHTAMTAQANGLYTGTIPGYAAATMVQFYVRGVDGLGAVSTYPAGGSNSGAFYVVADGQTDFSQGHNVRIIMSPSNWGLLRAPTNLMSSQFLPCSFIYDDSRPYYNLLVRLKGSMLGRANDAHPSFHLEFNADDLFRGVHSSMLIDTSGRATGVNPQEEICVHHMMLHAGIPEIRPDLCRVIPPYLTNTCNGVLEPRFEDEFISTAYPNGGSGTEFMMEIQYYTTAANAAGYKVTQPGTSDHIYTDGLDIKDYGPNKEAYRLQFQIKNHRNQDDYSRWIPFCQTLWLPNTPILDAQSRQVMDVDEWLRMFALISLVGESDWYSFSNPHNILMYVRGDNHRVTAFPWDVEQLFQTGLGGSPSTPLIGSVNNDWDQLESQFPDNTRRLYAHALDIINSTFNTGYMSYWTAHYTNFLPGQDFSDLLNWIPQRTSAVQSEINGAGGNTPFSLSGTNFIVTANNLVTLSGSAPVQVQSLLINGIAYPITWNSVSSWSINVPVSSLTNVLTITAYDLHGNLLTNTATLTVKYTGTAPNPIGSIVLNELMYDPLLPGASYVELFNSSASTSFDLSNWRINGLGYTFPPGTVLANGQYLVLVADQSAFISAYTNVPPFDIYPGTLSASGETLTLYMPGAQTNLPEVVVDKVRYATNAPWPATTPGVSLQLIDPAQDNSRVADWATAAGTPLTNNSVAATLPAFPPLWINELQADNLTGITNKAGQRTAWLELFNPGTNTVVLTNLYLSKNYTNLTIWAFPTNATIGPGQFKVIFADSQTNLSTTNELHTSFTLSSGAGSLALSRLYSGQPRVLDYVDYTNLMPNHSFGSFPDGQPFDRQEFFYVTPGASNNGTSAPLTVVINEWMAGNTLTLLDPVTGKYSDWFELYNYGTNTADLTGYYLTDNLTNEFKVQIPFGYTIPPHGFLLVWADSKNTNGTPELHVNFKLSKTGESIGLFGSDGTPVDYINYGPQTDDVSEGRYPDGSLNRFFMSTPTPRTNNVIPNTAPVVTTIANQIIYQGQTLSFTATATDAQSAFQTLTFSLDPGAPTGASIDPANGLFNWAATNVAVPSTNAITVRVTDNGTPPLSGTASFSVSVLPVPQLLGARPVAGKLPLTFSTLPGQTYQVQYKNTLEDADWLPLSTNIPGTGAVIEVDDPLGGQTQRFYRILILP